MDECIHSLIELTVFSTLDANSRYSKIEMDHNDINKKNSTLHHGLCQFARMIFGPCNAPGTFQRSIVVIHFSLKWHLALLDLEDIVISRMEPKWLIEHVRKVLPLLKNAGATLKLKLCSFATDTIDYLGHLIRPRWLKLAFYTTDAKRGLVSQSNNADFRSLLVVWNVFRRFVPNIARIAAPLSQRFKKHLPATFLPLDIKELDAIKISEAALMTPLILALPYSSGHWRPATDAFKF